MLILRSWSGLLTIALLWLGGATVHAESVTVNAGGGGDFTGLQAAIDRVLDNATDTITSNVITILDSATYTGGISLMGKGEHNLTINVASGQRPTVDGQFNCEDTDFTVSGIDFTVSDWTLLFIRNGGVQAGHGTFSDCTFKNLLDSSPAEISWAEIRDDATYTFSNCTIEAGRKIFEIKNGGTFTFNDCQIKTRTSDGNVFPNGINASGPKPTYNWNRCTIIAPNDGLFRMQGGGQPGDTDVLTYNFTNCVLKCGATAPTPIGWLQDGGAASFRHCTLLTNIDGVTSNTVSALILNNSASFRPFSLIFENNAIITHRGAAYGIDNFADANFTLSGGANLYNVRTASVSHNVATLPFETASALVVSEAGIDNTGHIAATDSPAVSGGIALTPAVNDDLDGETRPQPAFTRPDLGADETPLNINRARTWTLY